MLYEPFTVIITLIHASVCLSTMCVAKNVAWKCSREEIAFELGLEEKTNRIFLVRKDG